MTSRSCSLLASSRCRTIATPFRTTTSQFVNSRTSIPPPFLTQCRTKKTSSDAAKAAKAAKSNITKAKQREQAEKQKARRQKRTTFVIEDLKNQVQYSLCDAIRIIRAMEVGYGPTSSKYEMHVKLKTHKDGPVLRNRLMLPNPVRTDVRVCVICPQNMASKARAAGAVLAGTDEVFEAVKAGKIDFDRCLAHEGALKDLAKSGIARILGPKRLMPSPKDKTIVTDVVAAVKETMNAAEYRERMGVVRLSVGQLGFTAEQVQQNIQTVMKRVKKDISELPDKVTKEIYEVVLSSTHGPGLSLNGNFSSKDGIEPRELAQRV